MPAPSLFTIGYEGCTSDAVLAALRAAGVAVLLDVRALPLSRKPGFSKRQLAAGVEGQGMRYINLRGLGTPAAGRQAARAGRTAQMKAIFAEHMHSDPAQADLAHAIDLAQAGPVCLLCFERDHRVCHRDMVADLIIARTAQAVQHLQAANPWGLGPPAPAG